MHEFSDPKTLAANIAAEINSLAKRNTPNVRAIRRKYSQAIKQQSADFVIALTQSLLKDHNKRWVGYELIRNHPQAFASLNADLLEDLGRGIHSWSTVDTFGRILSGPAWLHGLIEDDLLQRWSLSEDRWWRRAALVSTVALNAKVDGGRGDTPRTLAICRQLAGDPDDMVVKAMSWALRELCVWDPQSVRDFLAEYDEVLAARVKREVNHKLETGLKYPRRPRKDSA